MSDVRGSRFIDLTDKVFGRLTVSSFAEVRHTAKGKQYLWNCRCECGNTPVVDGCCLRRGSTVSCGCFAKDRSTTHGMASHPLYVVWGGIKARCYNPNHKNYDEYGSRGIVMCDAWRDSFEAFYRDMGERPTPLHTVERKDNSLGYSPENCIWDTRAAQNENTRQTRLLTFQGVTLSIGKWAKRLGKKRESIRDRLNRGWTVERALTE